MSDTNQESKKDEVNATHGEQCNKVPHDESCGVIVLEPGKKKDKKGNYY